MLKQAQLQHAVRHQEHLSPELLHSEQVYLELQVSERMSGSQRWEHLRVQQMSVELLSHGRLRQLAQAQPRGQLSAEQLSDGRLSAEELSAEQLSAEQLSAEQQELLKCER